jgi:methionyl-tRNA synthetase
MLGGAGDWSGLPLMREVDEDGGPPYPVITGDYRTAARWESAPIKPGTKLATPTPLFAKLAPTVVAEELDRLEQG